MPDGSTRRLIRVLVSPPSRCFTKATEGGLAETPVFGPEERLLIASFLSWLTTTLARTDSLLAARSAALSRAHG